MPIPGESSEKGRTSTKRYIQNELLGLEELLDVATSVRPVADWDTEGARVNCALVT
jgi:ABC-type transporter lipoprotein component MlaA